MPAKNYGQIQDIIMEEPLNLPVNLPVNLGDWQDPQNLWFDWYNTNNLRGLPLLNFVFHRDSYLRSAGELVGHQQPRWARDRASLAMTKGSNTAQGWLTRCIFNLASARPETDKAEH